MLLNDSGLLLVGWIQRSVGSCLMGDLLETRGERKTKKWNWRIDDFGMSQMDLDLLLNQLRGMKNVYVCFFHENSPPFVAWASLSPPMTYGFLPCCFHPDHLTFAFLSPAPHEICGGTRKTSKS